MRRIIKNIREQLFSHPIESFCDTFFVFYALWTLSWILAYSTNLSLSEISPLFFLLIPLAVLTLSFKGQATGQLTPSATSHARRDTLTVLLLVAAAILLTLILHRPDSDDELYLGMAFSLLANADQPIQQLPGYENTFYAITAYEPLKAMVSHITGLPLLYSYYLLIPALMSAMTVIVTYRLLRELIPEGWFFGMLFFFVVMLAWGDVHRTFANFGFVRIFQGKSVLVSAIVPALFLYFFLLRDRLQARYHVFLLAAALISGVGFSRGGLVIGPLVLAFLGLASINFRTLGKLPTRILVFTGVLVAASLLFAYHSGWTLMNPSQLVYTSQGRVSTTTNLEMIAFTMGHGIRGIFLLICVAVGFMFVKDNQLRYTYRNFLAIYFLLLLFPWTSNLFAKMIQEFLSWRWLWITPVPVLASVAVGGVLARIRQVTNSAVALVVFLVIAAGFTAASPRRVLSVENLRWPDAKLDADSVYLRPYGKVATIKNGKLYLNLNDKGF